MVGAGAEGAATFPVFDERQCCRIDPEQRQAREAQLVRGRCAALPTADHARNDGSHGRAA